VAAGWVARACVAGVRRIGYRRAVASTPRPPDEPPLDEPPTERLGDERPVARDPSEARTRVMDQRRAPAGPPPPPPGRRRAPPGGIWPWLLALLIVVLGGLAAAYFLTRDDNGKEQVAVPSLVGLTQAQAVGRAGRVGLVANVNQVASDQPVGTVVDQDPASGTDVDRGSTVTVDVSSGPKQVTVPNVLGLNEATAGARLAQAGLEVRAVRVPSSQSAGKVVAQNPESGVTAAAGSTVRINVSRGPVPTTTVVTTTTTPTTTTAPTTTASASVRVPNVVGNTVNQAVNRIQAAGLVPRPTFVDSAEDPGRVIAQNPKPGANVSSGTTVRINISQPESPSP